MSFKRRVLSALGKDRLLEIGRGLELDVTTRMGVEELRDNTTRSFASSQSDIPSRNRIVACSCRTCDGDGSNARNSSSGP